MISETGQLVPTPCADLDEDRWGNEGGATNDPTDPPQARRAETTPRELAQRLLSTKQRALRSVGRVLKLGLA